MSSRDICIYLAGICTGVITAAGFMAAVIKFLDHKKNLMAMPKKFVYDGGIVPYFHWFPRMLMHLVFRIFMRRSFDEHGLKWSVGDLAKVKDSLPKMPLKFLCKFADRECIEQVEVFPFYITEAIELTEVVYFNHVNTTAIGNLAYIALHHPLRDIRRKAFVLLDNCFREHNKKH